MNAPFRGPGGRIAFLWPADGRNDDEYWNYLPDGVALLAARYPVAGGLELEDLESDADPEIVRTAAGLFRHVPVNAVALGDCAGSAVNGPDGARAMAAAAASETGSPAVTMIEAVVEAIRAVSARRVSLAAPYGARVTGRIVAYLEAEGVEVVRRRALEAESEAEIGDRPPERWAEVAESLGRGDADAVVLGGGGVRIAPVLDALEARMGVPVIAGPAALIWGACRRMGVMTAGAGPGRLFAGS